MMKLIGFYDYTVILTYISLVSSVMGMVSATRSLYGTAVFCLAFSGFCDMFDGAVARTKQNRTDDEKAFGIQLDSLCDMISFGAFPALLCYRMGADGILGLVCIGLYTLCALIRLAFFNVLEGKRQQVETGCNKYYRGLPVTTVSVILPVLYLLRGCFSESLFAGLLYGMLLVMAFLFVLDFRVKKVDIRKVFSAREKARQ